jgi:anti-anti-sigma regulatory factor
MKLTLKAQGPVQVLRVEGPVSAHEGQVIRAGIVKLMRDGKDRIVIDFSAVEDLDEPTLKEIGHLNFAARELSGGLTLLVSNPKLRSKIETIANPKPLGCFESFESASDFFKTGVLPTANVSLDDKMKAKDEEIQTLKQQLKEKEGGELASVKAEAATLKEEQARSLAQFEALVLERREPADVAAWKDKTAALEAKVIELSEKIVALQEAAASGDGKKPAPKT